MANESGGWGAPSWGDFWTSAADVEKELRCRVVIRMSGWKRVKNGSVVELFLVRTFERRNNGVFAHVDAHYPSNGHKSLPSLLITLLYQALELGMQADRREYRQPELLDLPLPPADSD